MSYTICEQQRCRSACAFAQSDQYLCCSLPIWYYTYTCYIQNVAQSVQYIWVASWQNQQNDVCAQQRLRSAWASDQSDQSSLRTQWVAKDPSFLHTDSEDSDQTGQMPRLIWVFAGCTGHFVGFVIRRSLVSKLPNTIAWHDHLNNVHSSLMNFWAQSKRWYINFQCRLSIYFVWIKFKSLQLYQTVILKIVHVFCFKVQLHSNSKV